jgi:hypothetical protein
MLVSLAIGAANLSPKRSEIYFRIGSLATYCPQLFPLQIIRIGLVSVRSEVVIKSRNAEVDFASIFT